MPEPVVRESNHPRLASVSPSVDVRTVLFTLADHRLLVALGQEDGPCLPRDVPTSGESLDHAARRIIHEAAGFVEQYIEQLYTLSLLETPDQWSVIVSYLALICSGSTPDASDRVRWQPADDPGELTAADRMVVDYAVTRLRAKLGYTNIAFHLLPQSFTLAEVQAAYETILGQPLDKRNFRRRMLASGILQPTQDKRREGSHRPAAIYRFTAENDQATYLTPPWATLPSGVRTA